MVRLRERVREGESDHNGLGRDEGRAKLTLRR